MSDENGGWFVQVSIKNSRGTLVNIRGTDSEDFKESLSWVTNLAPEITAAEQALEKPPVRATLPQETFKRPLPIPEAIQAADEFEAFNDSVAGLPTDEDTRPAPAFVAPRPVYQAPAPAPALDGTQIGPIVLLGCAVKQGQGKTGKPYTLWTANFSNGVTATTFDALYGSILQQNVSRLVYARVKDGKYKAKDLVDIRPAA